MINNDDDGIILPHGEVAYIANYKKQLLSEYNGNPLIEALPKILSKREYLDAVTNYPLFNESDRSLPPEVRLQCVMRMTHYFQPLSKHIDLEQRISRIIRHGYLSRNPLHAQYVMRLREIKKRMTSENKEERQNLLNYLSSSKSDPTGFTLIGISGVGKTTGLRNVLNLYPQVILHREYNGAPFDFYQIVWLRLECPHAGSLKGLCGEFFQEVDSLLGTNYYAKFGSTRNSEDFMLAQMVLICHLHGIGLLAIDEIQNLSEAKSGGADKMLNFFVKLINKGIAPVSMIGTNKAQKVLQSAFRQARRGTGVGDFYWDRFKFNEEEVANPATASKPINLWKFFIEEIFEYQWTKIPVAFNEEFSKTLYDESQGVTDIAIKLYMLAQWRAISTGIEKLTPSLIRQVASDSLMLVRPMLNALRSNKEELIAKYSDIEPLNMKLFYNQYKAEIEFEQQKELEKARDRITKERRTNSLPGLNEIILGLLDAKVPMITAQQVSEKVYAEQKPGDTLAELIDRAFRLSLTDYVTSKDSAINEKKTTKKQSKKYVQGDLRLIVADAKKAQRPAYSGLKDAGIIKSPLLELAI
ncbi:MAG: ATP-binding protein [Pyrinomonadaceae bacterium]|nr:ATP-binding protein [Pyrinomonadaceae bacterium]